jgi:hypothetical protein
VNSRVSLNLLRVVLFFTVRERMTSWVDGEMMDSDGGMNDG